MRGHRARGRVPVFPQEMGGGAVLTGGCLLPAHACKAAWYLIKLEYQAHVAEA